MICLNKDIFSSKIKVNREGRVTKGLCLNLYMQGTYQLDRETIEKVDADINFNDSCQVNILLNYNCYSNNQILKFCLILICL